MKKLLLVLAIVISVGAKAQLSVPSKIVGEYNDGDYFGKFQIHNGTGEWIYSNLEKTKRGIKYTIKFKGDIKLVEELYILLKTQMNKPFKTEYSFRLGEESINLFTTDPSPTTGKGLLVEINDTYFSLNETQLNKLFGK